MPEPVIKVADLTYYYPGESEPALQNVNLDINPGEFILLIGPSGCGKSTLALALNGIIPHVAEGRIKGHVTIGGRDTRDCTVYELGTYIGLVFQDPDTQMCNLYVEDEVAFGPANLMMERQEILDRVTRSLEDVSESDIRHKLIFEISGGQKQRVAIASILAMQPKIILFDEPTANLDPLGAVQVFQLLRKLNQETGLTVVVIEHNVDSVMAHADRLILMDEGTVRYCGPTREIMRATGRQIMDELGLRIPHVSELALRLAEHQLILDPFPLTLEETVAGLDQVRDQLEFALPAAPPPVAAQPPIIRTEQLNFIYPDGTHAVRDVSLEIRRTEVIALVGKNGSGKSTLTSMFIGLNKPTSGRGWVSGLDLATTNTQALAGKAGYVFQYPEHQFVEDTVYKEVAFSLKSQKRPPAEVEERVNYALTLFGLEKMRDRHPLRLSMGQKRRLSVATMLVLDPEILILDEPTTGQDKKNIDNIMDIMMRSNRRGTTIILVTHDMNLVAQYCGRILVMDQGELVFSGTPLEFGRQFAQIRSSAMLLPEIYALTKTLRERGLAGVPEVSTVDEFMSALKVTA